MKDSHGMSVVDMGNNICGKRMRNVKTSPRHPRLVLVGSRNTNAEIAAVF